MKKVSVLTGIVFPLLKKSGVLVTQWEGRMLYLTLREFPGVPLRTLKFINNRK